MTPRETFLKYLQTASKEGRTTLMEDEAAAVCQSYGIATPESRFAEAGKAADVAAAVGYPLVMKILSPHISHKSDVGGVRLNIRTAEEARQASEGILASVKSHAPNAAIRGFWLAQMAGNGVETIVGLKRDEVFGPVVMFGVGGVFVEIYKDVAFSVCPLQDGDVEEMIGQVKGRKILEGFRGMPKANMPGLKKILQSVCTLGSENPEIESIDLNPVWADSERAMALDARIVVHRA